MKRSALVPILAAISLILAANGYADPQAQKTADPAKEQVKSAQPSEAPPCAHKPAMMEHGKAMQEKLAEVRAKVDQAKTLSDPSAKTDALLAAVDALVKGMEEMHGCCPMAEKMMHHGHGEEGCPAAEKEAAGGAKRPCPCGATKSPTSKKEATPKTAPAPTPAPAPAQ